MKRWGIVITAFYGLAVAMLFVPGFYGLVAESPTVSGIFQHSREIYSHWLPWTWIGVLVGGEALLLFLSVDTSWRHAKPRRHIAVTAGLASFFAALLVCSALLSIGAGVYGDRVPPFWKDKEEPFVYTVLGTLAGLWVIWGGVFYEYYRNSPNAVSRIVTWLLRGSVLELLIAVPAHVIVRHRGDCSAPYVTSFGIVTGLAIMLLCFGPSVLALYKKRLDSYSHNTRKLQIE